MGAHNVMGVSLTLTGDSAEGRAHFDRALALYDPTAHRPLATRLSMDVRVANLSYRSLALWMLGYPEEALTDAKQCLREARGIRPSYWADAGTTTCNLRGNLLRKFRSGKNANRRTCGFGGEKSCVRLEATWNANPSLDFCPDRRSLGSGADDHLPDQHVSLNGATVWTPLFTANLATTHAEIGRLDDASRCIDDAITAMETTKEKWFEAEVYRMAGGIPASLHELLMARLDRLPTLREVAQLGAVLGRDFAYEMLRAITALDEPRLRDVLGLLVEAELLYQRGRPPRARYMFKHALIQDAAYQSLLRRTRQQYHRQVAELLESNFVDTVEASPELLAHHYSEAGLPGPAVIYWLRAGENATKRSANLEAIGHLTAGLAQLAQLPEAPERATQELALQRLLGQASFAAKGYASPEATRAFSRARELCATVGDDVSIYPILAGVLLFELTGGYHANAETTAKEMLDRACRTENTGAVMAAKSLLAIVRVHLGSLASARPYFEEAMAWYSGVPVGEAARLAYEYGLDLAACELCIWLLVLVAARLSGPGVAVRRRGAVDCRSRPARLFPRSRALLEQRLPRLPPGMADCRRARGRRDQLGARARPRDGGGSGPDHARGGASDGGAA